VLIQYLGDAQYLDKNGNLKPDGSKPVAHSTMTGIAAAINDLYREAKLLMSAEVRQEFAKFMRGYKRKIADKKQNGEMKIFEGKRPISFKGFILLARHALVSQQNDAIFAHLYVVFCWNLFSRSNNIANIMYDHIEWKEDALMINVPKHKGDQEGANSLPKHCYADPFTPEICPVLALALHIFCTSFRAETTDHRLFSGSSLEGKFSNWLSSTLKSEGFKDNPELGALIEELGTHSFRWFMIYITYIIVMNFYNLMCLCYVRSYIEKE
jgi:hypothetical protein